MTLQTIADAIAPVTTTARFTIDQFEQMLAAGVFAADDSLELLDGQIFATMNINPAHSYITDELRDQLTSLLPSGYFVKSQQPIQIPDRSRPQPDLIVVRGEKAPFYRRHPLPADIVLVVEVADASLRRDQELKYALYAAAGIPQCWIVNIPRRQIEVYTDPVAHEQAAAYRRMTLYFERDQLPVSLDGRPIGEIAVGKLLL